MASENKGIPGSVNSTTFTLPCFSFGKHIGDHGMETTVIPSNFHFRHCHFRQVRTSREYHLYDLCMRAGIFFKGCRLSLDFYRIAQLQNLEYRMHVMAGHIAKSTGTKIPPTTEI